MLYLIFYGDGQLSHRCQLEKTNRCLQIDTNEVPSAVLGIFNIPQIDKFIQLLPEMLLFKVYLTILEINKELLKLHHKINYLQVLIIVDHSRN